MRLTDNRLAVLPPSITTFRAGIQRTIRAIPEPRRTAICSLPTAVERQQLAQNAVRDGRRPTVRGAHGGVKGHVCVGELQDTDQPPTPRPRRHQGSRGSMSPCLTGVPNCLVRRPDSPYRLTDVSTAVVVPAAQPSARCAPVRSRLRPEDRGVHGWYRLVLSLPSHLVRDYPAGFRLDSTQGLSAPSNPRPPTLLPDQQVGGVRRTCGYDPSS